MTWSGKALQAGMYPLVRKQPREQAESPQCGHQLHFMVCGRKKTETEISCSGRRFGQRFGIFHPPSQDHCLGGHIPLSTEVFTTNTHQKNKSSFSCSCEWHPLYPLHLHSWEEMEKANLEVTPSSHPSQFTPPLAGSSEKHTYIHSTSWDGRALSPLQSALISSNVCSTEDNLEAMACSRTHCLTHTAIKCTSLSGCPVSLRQEGLSSS